MIDADRPTDSVLIDQDQIVADHRWPVATLAAANFQDGSARRPTTPTARLPLVICIDRILAEFTDRLNWHATIVEGRRPWRAATDDSVRQARRAIAIVTTVQVS